MSKGIKVYSELNRWLSIIVRQVFRLSLLFEPLVRLIICYQDLFNQVLLLYSLRKAAFCHFVGEAFGDPRSPKLIVEGNLSDVLFDCWRVHFASVIIHVVQALFCSYNLLFFRCSAHRSAQVGTRRLVLLYQLPRDD